MIDADALLEEMRPSELPEEEWEASATYKIIQSMPTVDVRRNEEPSRWLITSPTGGQMRLTCQCCRYETKRYATMEYYYCPSCGAKMMNGKDV